MVKGVLALSFLLFGLTSAMRRLAAEEDEITILSAQVADAFGESVIQETSDADYGYYGDFGDYGVYDYGEFQIRKPRHESILQETETVSPTCKLSKEDVELQGGKEGFKVFVKCTEAVANPKLKIDGFKPAGYKTIEVNAKMRIGIYSKAQIGKARMTFAWKENGVEVESNSIYAQDEVVIVTLPCKLYKKDVTLQGNKAGFEVSFECWGPVSNQLQFRLEGYKPKLYNPPFPLKEMVRLGIYDKETYGDVKMKLAGEFHDNMGESNVIKGNDPDLLPPQCNDLPCKLSTKDVTLTGGKSGFTLRAVCTETVEKPILRIKGFSDKGYATITASSEVVLGTYSKAQIGDQPMQLFGKRQGETKECGSEIIYA